MEDLISVIMPAYNSKNFIKESLCSALNQTYKNIEIIVVDDCSTDGTSEIIKQIQNNDSRIKYYRLDENSGAAVARTIAMEKANGIYFSFLDSDDIWKEDKLEKQIVYMKNNNILFCATAYEIIDEDKNKLVKVLYPPVKTNYNRLLLDCPVGNSTIVYDASVLGKFIVPNIRKRNDDALWLRILKKTKYIYGMNDILTLYRVRKNSISSNKISLIKYHWILYREIENLSILRSIFHICYWCVIKILKIK